MILVVMHKNSHYIDTLSSIIERKKIAQPKKIEDDKLVIFLTTD
ncbi:MAG: hypothetical protein RAP41_03095 [Candidatus Orphnella occulta]|nr:hypothetical protein [Candidatus Orphnella occulta]MDP8297152.1 hypothetical protein [Candidatus Orphnella occulta]